MIKFLSLLEKIISYTIVISCFFISVFAMMRIFKEEVMLSITEWIPYLYIATIIIIVYKMTVIFITTFYDVKITKRTAHLRSIIEEQEKEKALQDNKTVVHECVSAVKVTGNQVSYVNIDAIVDMLKERLPEVVQELVNQQVEVIEQNLIKKYEERSWITKALSTTLADAVKRRIELKKIKAKINRREEERQKIRLNKTLLYTKLVFSSTGMKEEDIEKVCDVVELFIKTGQVITTKDFHIPLNKKLRNAELRQFVYNITRYNEKDNLDGDSFLQTAFGEWFSGKKENIAKSYSMLPKDSLVSKDGVEADLERLRKSL